MKIKCPACGFKNKEGANFCSNCNEPLVTPNISVNKQNINIKRIAKEEGLRINKKQRLILAIFVPIILFFVAFTVAYYSAATIVPGMTNLIRLFETGVVNYSHNPFDWEKTWYVWLVYLIFVCIFEYKLFEDKKIISNKKKKELK